MFKKLLNNLMGNDTPNPSHTAANDREQEAQPASHTAVTYDPETYHGTHYTEAAFDAEVEKRLQYELNRRTDENLDEADIRNWRHNLRRSVYLEWNRCDTDQMLQFETANSLKYNGIATSGFVKEDSENPLLAPIHGISLKDYAAMCMKMGNGVSTEAVCKAMGLEPAIWEELNVLWPKRMQEDATFTVTTLFGQYFTDGATHPNLEQLTAAVSEDGAGNLEKIKTDEYFYHELCGARQAAYDYGLDGAQWILDHYGISLGDFQAAAMTWMTQDNLNTNTAKIQHFMDYQQEKQKEYAAKFAAAQGGNVADDITF